MTKPNSVRKTRKPYTINEKKVITFLKFPTKEGLR